MNNYALLRKEYIQDIKSEVKLYEHNKTKAQIISILNNDENKCFCVAFKTPPYDSTGLPHILEHMVLAGSRKYRLKEPFFNLLKNSLATFLNAATSRDFTIYPVASTNLTDFYNLVDVYLDSVFFPLLTENTFKQEAWRWHKESKDSNLQLVGIVYNEMKAFYTNEDFLVGENSIVSLFPDTEYKNSFGGDPIYIPNLTHDKLVEYHQKYYHPSNAKILFYGDDPEGKRFEILDKYLDEFSFLSLDNKTKKQRKFDAPREYKYPYPSSNKTVENSSDYIVTLSWAFDIQKDVLNTISLEILFNILLGNPGSPLYKALEDSNLGKDIISDLDFSISHPFCIVGLKQVEQDNIDKVEDLIMSTLKSLSMNGISYENVESSINIIEFHYKEMNTGKIPVGLVIIKKVLKTWLYDQDPVDILKFENTIKLIKNKIKNGEKYFENLIHKFFLENTHRVKAIFYPDKNYVENLNKIEKDKITEFIAKHDESFIQKIIQETQEFLKWQNTPDSIEEITKLPKLKVTDLDKDIKKIPTEIILDKDSSVILTHNIETKEIVYINLAFDLASVPKELIPFVGIYSKVLAQIDTEKHNYVDLLNSIDKYTGGIDVSILTGRHIHVKDDVLRLVISAKSTLNNLEHLINILQEVILETKFDNFERIKKFVQSELEQMKVDLMHSARSFIGTRISAHFSYHGMFADFSQGISYFEFLKELNNKLDSEWIRIKECLNNIKKLLINKNSLIINITVLEKYKDEVLKMVYKLLDSIPNIKNNIDFSESGKLLFTSSKNEIFTIPTQVNYVGKGVLLDDIKLNLDGSDMIILRLVLYNYLMNKIRLEGGAYGVRGFYAINRNILSFVSYRDPHLQQTLSVYDSIPDYLQNLEITQQDIDECIIGTVGELDEYKLPQQKGLYALQNYLFGISDAFLQSLKDQMLNTKIDDVYDFIRYATKLAQEGDIVIFSSTQNIQNFDKLNLFVVKSLF